MSDDVIISVKNLNKTFKLYQSPKHRLLEAIHPLRKKYHHDYQALKDISFEIKRGESIGILGKNGAGKSTLLKILTGVLTPSAGEVVVKGRIAALLELGSGFNPDLSGLENIYFQGAIMGFTQDEMAKKAQEIIKFADIGEFINQPVKTYSSGMFARLAFSIAINVDPDILIVDEALAVGDMFFQLKCFEKFKVLSEAGVTILFVSHSLESVIEFCQRGVVLDKGCVVNSSDAKSAVNFFKKLTSSGVIPEENIKTVNGNWRNSYEINPNSQIYGVGNVVIDDFGLFDKNNHLINGVLSQGDSATLKFKINAKEKIENIIVAYAFKNIKGFEAFGGNSYLESGSLIQLEKDCEYAVEIEFEMLLNPGNYFLSLGVVSLSGEEFVVQQRLYDIISINIVSNKPGTGIFKPHREILIRRLDG